MNNVIKLYDEPNEPKDYRCSFCGDVVKKAISREDEKVCICYKCVALATQKLNQDINGEKDE